MMGRCKHAFKADAVKPNHQPLDSQGRYRESAYGCDRTKDCHHTFTPPCDFLSTASIAKQGDNVLGSVSPSVGQNQPF